MKATRSAAIILFFFLATAVITFPFVQVLGGTLYNWGDSLLEAWILGWNTFQLIANPLHLYEAPSFYPYPHTLAYTDTLVPQSLLSFPIILATNNIPLGHNLNVVFAFTMNGYGMYLLIRAWKGNLWGGLIGGTIFAFGHYHLSQFQHLHLLSTEWMPFVLIYLDRALSHPRAKHCFLFGLFFLLSALSSFYYAFMTASMVLVYLAFQFIAKRRQLRWIRIRNLFITILFVFFATLPFGLPYVQLAREFGLTRTISEAVSLSATPQSYLASLTQTAPFVWLREAFPAPHGEATLCPGYLAFLLVLYGLYRRSRANSTLVYGLTYPQ